jgi:exopolysaccharide biosynthesis WecB/TagA/CpsF family protein
VEAVTNTGKRNVLGVLVDVVDYQGAVRRIVEAAEEGRPYAATALAVHGVMTGVLDPEQRYRLNHLDLVTPDGQPVRWALNLLYRTALPDRVYGPRLTERLCREAVERGLKIYLYGSREEVVRRMSENLQRAMPRLMIAGAEPSKFRAITPKEKEKLTQRIRESGAKIVLVGIGCPRQEIFAYEFRSPLSMPVVAVGAAFEYHAGVQQEPPRWVQDWGLQWVHRLAREPRRLWKRYLLLNAAYIVLLLAQATGAWRPDPASGREPRQELLLT